MRRIVAVVVGASLLLLPGCGKKTDETARAAGITPATALGLISVNLSPSIEQQRNLLAISRRFPDAAEKAKGEFEDARDALLTTILEDSGLDYVRDVEPWLGKEAAAVVLPPGDAGVPLIVAMVQTDDKEAAEAAIAKATEDGGFDGAYAVIDDYVVISDQDDPADNQPALDQIAAQAEEDEGSLAESDEFNNVVDELAGDRLILGWVDAGDSFAVAEDLAGTTEVLSFLKPLGKGSIAFDVHVESKAVVFEGVAEASGEGGGSGVELTRTLPATTLAALTMFDVGGLATEALQQLGGVGGADFAGELEANTGIDLQEDVLSWMKGEAVVVVGPVRDGQDHPDFGFVAEPTEEARAAAGMAKIRDKLAATGFPLERRPIGDAVADVLAEPFAPGLQPAMALYPDRFVLANSPAYLGDLARAARPGLGSNDTYASLLGDDKTTGQFILLIDPIRQAIENALLPEGPERDDYEMEVKPNLEPLAAFGVKANRERDFNTFEMKLTLD